MTSIVKGGIAVLPSDRAWKEHYLQAKAQILQVLKDNVIAIHHVGSTSVEGLCAKPKIDILVEVQAISQEALIAPMASIQCLSKGEFNIPTQATFTRRGEQSWNIHVFPKGHPEIALNLAFRDYLRSHFEAVQEYSSLKYALISDPSMHETTDSGLRSYTLHKAAFIQKCLKASGFNELRILKYSQEPAQNLILSQYQKDPIFGSYEREGCEESRLEWIFLYQGVQPVGLAKVEIHSIHSKLVLLGICIWEKDDSDLFYHTILEKCAQWAQSMSLERLAVVESRAHQQNILLHKEYKSLQDSLFQKALCMDILCALNMKFSYSSIVIKLLSFFVAPVLVS